MHANANDFLVLVVTKNYRLKIIDSFVIDIYILYIVVTNNTQIFLHEGINPRINKNMSKRNNRKSRPGSRPVTGAAASDISNSDERSSSALPILNESMRSMSLTTASASAKDPRSQSVRQVTRRRGLDSAVPDSAELSPVNRPDKGGSKGQTISVYTNHFRVDIGDNTVYQYEIEIVMIDRNFKIRQAVKDDRWNVIQFIVKQNKNFPTVWYDEGKALYSQGMLPELSLPLQIILDQDNEVKTFQLKRLDLVRQDRTQSIYEFIQKRTNIRPRETVRIIETLFKQNRRNDLICVRNQFYDRRRQLDDLGDGRGMAKGFYQALFLTQCGPTLNINLTFTCFYMPMNFVEFARQYLRKDITKGINDTDLKIFERMVRNIKIETMHTGRKIYYALGGFGRPANQLTFTRGDDNEQTAGAAAGEDITVANYFAQKYRRLMYPNLPCINGKKGNQNKPNWIPMEVARIVEWQRALRPLDKQQRGKVSQTTILKPQQRYDEIMKIVENNYLDRDPYLRKMNIRVHDKEMLKLDARILNTPDIKYRRRGQGQSEVIEHVQFGKWKLRNWFYETPVINAWGIIYFGDTPQGDVYGILEEFQNQLPQLLQRTGFVIRGELSLTIKGTTEYDINKALVDASRQRWQLAIVVLNSYNSDDVYSFVKRYGNREIGLRTQCVNYQALKRNIPKLNMYVENISQKINGKLGGINGVVNLKQALSRSSRDDLFMFFGADVTHPACSSDRPSIAAVVGSKDVTNSIYTARLCEQYPKKGRCSVEIIKELDTMVIELLGVFAKSCGDRLPNKIVFYRDGVDEGQYQKVLDHEVTKMKNAFRAVYGKRPLPQLTFIIVKKRHNTRFFLYENGQTLNVQAGTVIDQGITHPSQFDFYLCSQAAIMGTSRPALYHVLHDEIGFSSDDIQQLTYWLCHTDMRCTKSVSIPAPVHYAHLAAYASRILKFGEDHERESVGENNEEPENYSLDDIKTELMALDGNVADTMWFI